MHPVCNDEPLLNLVPYVDLSVSEPPFIPPINVYYEFVPMLAGFLFTMNDSYIWTNVSAPRATPISQIHHIQMDIKTMTSLC